MIVVTVWRRHSASARTTDGQDCEVAVESAADNVIVRTVELEEERLADVESAELFCPGLPENNFAKSI